VSLAAEAEAAEGLAVHGEIAQSLRRNRDFRAILASQAVSAFGDAVSYTALPLLVLALTGSGAQMGLVGVLQMLPDLLFGLVAGALADRWDRRRLMLYADLGRALLIALIPLSVVLGLDTMAVILLVTAPINVLRVLFLAGYTAAVPSIVGRTHVGRANGYAEAIFSISFIVGPAVAGLLVALIGPGLTLAVDAASFLLSAGALAFIRRQLRAARDTSQRRILAEIADGVRYIAQQRTLRVVIAFWSVVNISAAPLVPAVVFYLTADRAAPAGVVGLVISAYGAGYLVGALLAGRWAKGRLGLLMLGANVPQAGVIAVFALTESVPLMVACTVGTGLSGALVFVSYLTVRATIPPDELIGRVGSTARTISLGLSPLGLMAGGVLLDLVGGSGTLLVIGAIMLAASAVFATSAEMRQAAARAEPGGAALA
jgi:MFS family permease